VTSGLVAQLRAAASVASADLPVAFAYLYGSRADGRPRTDSDIDIGVVAADPTFPADRLAARCSDALSAASGLGGIETTVLDDAPLRFHGRVLRHRVVIFSRDEPRRVRFESLIGRMADDVEIWAAPLDRDLLAAIAEGRR
jgi:predicted nucleotidyltransferase